MSLPGESSEKSSGVMLPPCHNYTEVSLIAMKLYFYTKKYNKPSQTCSQLKTKALSSKENLSVKIWTPQNWCRRVAKPLHSHRDSGQGVERGSRRAVKCLRKGAS